MAIITLTGNVDKRVIAYPLLKAMSIVGPTGVISDDTSLKRLYRDKGWKGRVDCIDIALTLDFEQDYEVLFDDFGNVHTNYLFITDNFIPPRSNFVLMCRGITESSFLQEIQDEVEEKKGEVLILTSNDKHKKMTNNMFAYNGSHLQFFSQMEEQKVLSVPKDNLLRQFIAKTFASPLGMRPEELFKVLDREEVQKRYEKF